jgi:hypothetical protein
MVNKKEHTMSSWILDGQRIAANYLGQKVRGTVESSRVKYGGKVCYTLNLDQPTQFPWRSEPSTQVLIDCDEIIANLL